MTAVGPSSVIVGSTGQLVATVDPESVLAEPGVSLVYTSSAPTVATVDNTGLVTGLTIGSAIIYCDLMRGDVSIAGTEVAIDIVEDPNPPAYDGTNWELSVGPGWLYLGTGLSTTKYVVDWGDGSPPVSHGTSGGVLRHNYTAASSTCTITIEEKDLTAVQHHVYGPALLGVNKWPTKVITGVKFTDAGYVSNLTYIPEHLPAAWTNLSSMFEEVSSFNQDISMWDTSNITNMANMFVKANSFNRNIGSWNVLKVREMNNMFFYNTAFNQDISGWDVRGCRLMYGMFSGGVFNQPIGTWQTQNVTDMGAMFQNNTSFVQDISGWNVAKVTSRNNFATNTNPAWTTAMKPVFP